MGASSRQRGAGAIRVGKAGIRQAGRQAGARLQGMSAHPGLLWQRAGQGTGKKHELQATYSAMHALSLAGGGAAAPPAQERGGADGPVRSSRQDAL